MAKKGQLTIFIIIGIVLVFAVAMIIYLQRQITNAGFEATPLSALSTESQPVKLFVDKCLEDAATTGIYFMGTQGGYINPPLDSLLTENSVIPYYYYRGSDTMPSLTELEKEISLYVERTLPVCTNGFEDFSQEIQEGDVRATTRINEQNVLIKALYPLTIKNSQGKLEKIDTFVVDVPVRLGHIYDIAKNVVDRQVSDPNILDLTYFSSFDSEINILPYDGSSTIFSITDRKSLVKGVDYQLFFANGVEPNTNPQLDFIPDFVLKKDVLFQYQITAKDFDNDELTFSDDTDLFDINKNTGMISFTPRSTGTFTAIITASDSRGKKDSTAVRFDVR